MKKCKTTKSAFVADIEHVSGTSVGGFCRWRGCICPGMKTISASGKTKFMLCSLHQTLRQFLEGSGAKDELARHLPSSKSKNRHRHLLPKLEARWRQSSI